jgi:hypothetical protein
MSPSVKQVVVPAAVALFVLACQAPETRIVIGGKPSPAGPARDPAGAAVPPSPDGWYGAAMLEADGTIVLQLRSVQADGTIAEGMIHYPKTHPEYQRILVHTGKLMVGVWKPIPPWPEPQGAPAATSHPR